MTDDFLRRLHELDATYAGRSVPGGLEDRALARLREAQTRRRARPWTRQALALGFVAGAVAALVFTRTRGTPDAAQTRPAIASADLVSADTIDLAGVTMTSRPCAPTREGDVVALPTACHLSGAGVQLSTLGPSRLSGGAGPLRVLSGAVHFDVAPRERAAPLAIAVSGGVIEVVGTRFLVREDGARGDVELFEGRLRFVGEDGSVRMIAPGERLAWGGDAAPAVLPVIEPSAPPPAPTADPPPRRRSAEAQEISRQVTAHRHRGAHAEAARALETALRAGGWPRGTAEVWSYELGTLYADELDDRAAACAHWREHLRRFARGAYAPAVDAAMKRLECAR